MRVHKDERDREKYPMRLFDIESIIESRGEAEGLMAQSRPVRIKEGSKAGRNYPTQKRHPQEWKNMVCKWQPKLRREED